MYSNEQIAEMNSQDYQRAVVLGRIRTADIPRDVYVRKTIDRILNAGPTAGGVTDAQVRRWVSRERWERGNDLDDLVEAVRAGINHFMGWKTR